MCGNFVTPSQSFRLIKRISLVYFRFTHTSMLQERVMLTERIMVEQMMMAKLTLRGNSLLKYITFCKCSLCLPGNT